MGQFLNGQTFGAIQNASEEAQGMHLLKLFNDLTKEKPFDLGQTLKTGKEIINFPEGSPYDQHKAGVKSLMDLLSSRATNVGSTTLRSILPFLLYPTSVQRTLTNPSQGQQSL